MISENGGLLESGNLIQTGYPTAYPAAKQKTTRGIHIWALVCCATDNQQMVRYQSAGVLSQTVNQLKRGGKNSIVKPNGMSAETLDKARTNLSEHAPRTKRTICQATGVRSAPTERVFRDGNEQSGRADAASRAVVATAARGERHPQRNSTRAWHPVRTRARQSETQHTNAYEARSKQRFSCSHPYPPLVTHCSIFQCWLLTTTRFDVYQRNANDDVRVLSSNDDAWTLSGRSRSSRVLDQAGARWHT